MRAIIVGCGIGGISTALALRKAGIDYVVLEQAPELLPVGAGIQLSPNAVRILEWLGLEEGLAEVGVRPGEHRFIDWQSGEIILRTPLGKTAEETFGAPYYHAHRADLLDLLVNALNYDRVRLGCKVDSVEVNGATVSAHLADGTVETGDVLIGADGIHSMVRAQFFAEDAPEFSGNVAWRGLVPAEKAAGLGIEHNSHVWMGPGRSMVLYYVSGGRMVNWVGLCPATGKVEESWSAKGTVEDALKDYAGFHEQVTGLIEATETTFKWAIHDRRPLETWVDGRIALLGDAAHSMLPYHAQGAAQSIEDAWVLARSLEIGSDDVESALNRYQDLRRERAIRVQEMSRVAGKVFEATTPEDIERRNRRFRDDRAKNASGFPPGQLWLYGYDAEKAVLGEDADWRASSW